MMIMTLMSRSRFPHLAKNIAKREATQQQRRVRNQKHETLARNKLSTFASEIHSLIQGNERSKGLYFAQQKDQGNKNDPISFFEMREDTLQVSLEGRQDFMKTVMMME